MTRGRAVVEKHIGAERTQEMIRQAVDRVRQRFTFALENDLSDTAAQYFLVIGRLDEGVLPQFQNELAEAQERIRRTQEEHARTQPQAAQAGPAGRRGAAVNGAGDAAKVNFPGPTGRY